MIITGSPNYVLYTGKTYKLYLFLKWWFEQMFGENTCRNIILVSDILKYKHHTYIKDTFL